jgi:hypothetical protein
MVRTHGPLGLQRLSDLTSVSGTNWVTGMLTDEDSPRLVLKNALEKRGGGKCNTQPSLFVAYVFPKYNFNSPPGMTDDSRLTISGT